MKKSILLATLFSFVCGGLAYSSNNNNQDIIEENTKPTSKYEFYDKIIETAYKKGENKVVSPLNISSSANIYKILPDDNQPILDCLNKITCSDESKIENVDKDWLNIEHNTGVFISDQIKSKKVDNNADILKIDYTNTKQAAKKINERMGTEIVKPDDLKLSAAVIGCNLKATMQLKHLKRSSNIKKFTFYPHPKNKEKKVIVPAGQYRTGQYWGLPYAGYFEDQKKKIILIKKYGKKISEPLEDNNYFLVFKQTLNGDYSPITSEDMQEALDKMKIIGKEGVVIPYFNITSNTDILKEFSKYYPNMVSLKSEHKILNGYPVHITKYSETCRAQLNKYKFTAESKVVAVSSSNSGSLPKDYDNSINGPFVWALVNVAKNKEIKKTYFIGCVVNPQNKK